MRRWAPILIALAVAFVIAVIFWVLAVLVPSLWFGYEWPSIKGNGPEDLTSLLIVSLVTAGLYPPLRRWIARELDHIHAKQDHVIDVLHHIVKHTDDEVLPNTIGGVHIDELRPARGRPTKGAT